MRGKTVCVGSPPQIKPSLDNLIMLLWQKSSTLCPKAQHHRAASSEPLNKCCSVLSGKKDTISGSDRFRGHVPYFQIDLLPFSSQRTPQSPYLVTHSSIKKKGNCWYWIGAAGVNYQNETDVGHQRRSRVHLQTTLKRTSSSWVSWSRISLQFSVLTIFPVSLRRPTHLASRRRQSAARQSARGGWANRLLPGRVHRSHRPRTVSPRETPHWWRSSATPYHRSDREKGFTFSQWGSYSHMQRHRFSHSWFFKFGTSPTLWPFSWVVLCTTTLSCQLHPPFQPSPAPAFSLASPSPLMKSAVQPAH